MMPGKEQGLAYLEIPDNSIESGYMICLVANRKGKHKAVLREVCSNNRIQHRAERQCYLNGTGCITFTDRIIVNWLHSVAVI